MRGAKNGKRTRDHLLSAIDQDTHAVLVQVAVRKEINDIRQFPVFLDHSRSLAGVVVTAVAYADRSRPLSRRARAALHLDW